MPFLKRLEGLQALLKASHVDACVVEASTDLFYLTGILISTGRLIVHANGARLFVDGRYIEVCNQRSPFPVSLVPKESIAEFLAQMGITGPCFLAFDSQQTTYAAYLDLCSLLEKAGSFSSGASRWTAGPLDNFMRKLRGIKDDGEISLLRHAAALSMEGFHYASSLLKEGISEREIARELEVFWLLRGGEKVSFELNISFGPHSAMPHHRAGDSRLTKGQIVLMDIGVVLNRYHSDMTRVLFFGESEGSPPDQTLKEIYKIVEHAKQASLALCRPGVFIGEVDAAARKSIVEAGYGEFFTHGLGHGIGLETHEWPGVNPRSPYKETPLAPGMVITIEPGIYLPGLGGVRLEDTIAITSTGYENLTTQES